MATTEEKIKALPKRIGVSVVLLVIMTGVLVACDPWVTMVTFALVGGICACEVFMTPASRPSTIYWGPRGFWTARLLMIAIVIVGWVSASSLFWVGGEYRDMYYLGLVGAIAADIFALVGGLLGGKLVRSDRLKRVLLARPVQVISEGKTVLGFVIGLLASGIAVALTGRILGEGAAPSLWLVVVIPVAAVGGDLLASAAKRVIGAGDYTIGEHPPLLGDGHGGWMDRFDSIFSTWAVLGIASAMYVTAVWLATLVGELFR